MEMDNYQKLAFRTVNKDLSAHDMEDHAKNGMVGEIGEICSLYQKFYQGHPLDKTHVKKELGDLLWFIAEFATANGWRLSEVAEMNIEKLRRRYPEGFDTEHSLFRENGDI